MTTYKIVETYEPENKIIMYGFDPEIPSWYEGEPEGFMVRPYDKKMAQLYLAASKHGKYRDQNAFDYKYANAMAKRARGPVYVGRGSDEGISLTRPYAVYREVYGIAQTNDTIKHGDRFVYVLDGEEYIFELDRAWLEQSPGAIKATAEENAERAKRGFSSEGEISTAIYDDAPMSYDD